MKTFVMSAVAATIAASSAMAAPGSPLSTSEVEWYGAVNDGDLGAASCEFTENKDGIMHFDKATTAWTTSQAASVVMTQSGAVGVKVYPDLFARELNGFTAGAGESSNKPEGVAHAVNVDYTGEVAGGTDAASSSVEVLRQDAADPGQNGNEWVLLSETNDGTGEARGSVVYRDGTNTGSYMVGNGAAVNGGVAGMLIAEEGIGFVHSSEEGNFDEGDLPVAMKISIAGSATLINPAEVNLLKEGSAYGITHNIVCLQ